MLTCEEIYPGIYHFYTASQYELAMTFIRIQEFFESNNPYIRGQFFTLEDFMDAYADATGNFTYTSDFLGFNFSGELLDNFCNVFEGSLRSREKRMIDLLMFASLRKRGKKIYIIGSCGQGEYLNHEVAHGFYYLDTTYKIAVDELTSQLSPGYIRKFKRFAASMTYADDVLRDELHAYSRDVGERPEGYSSPFGRANPTDYRICRKIFNVWKRKAKECQIS